MRINYRSSDGQNFVGYLARPPHPAGSAIIVAHSAPGIGDHERDVAESLASQGYIVLAADYQGDGALLEGEALNAKLEEWARSPQPFRIALQAAHARMLDEEGVDPDKVAIVGYCSGGLAALEYARTGADVRAVIGIHSSLPTGDQAAARMIRASVLILNGTKDPFVPREMRTAFETEMDDAGCDWQMNLFGGVEHAFTLRNAASSGWLGVAYDATADKRSWKAMLAFLAETIGKPAA